MSEKIKDQAGILCIGLCCLDIIQTCGSYPQEDSDTRCLECRIQRGGNASNMCSVLSQFNCNTTFLGFLSNDHHLPFIKQDMLEYGIRFDNCPEDQNHCCPTSTVIFSKATGSRTIIHYNSGLSELTLNDFKKLDLSIYAWIHFEGRNVEQSLLMMEHIKNHNMKMMKENGLNVPIIISAELEKCRTELMKLLQYADVVFLSKDFALSRGCTNMRETIEYMNNYKKIGAIIFIAWGDKGAMAEAPDKTVVEAPAFPPETILDSLGAGDTFNAAAIFSLHKALSFYRGKFFNYKATDSTFLNDCLSPKIIEEAVIFACQIAGAKIGKLGFKDLEDICKNFY